MKRIWPEEDDMIWLAVGLAVFFIICINVYISLS